jgi:hypothetical protein
LYHWGLYERGLYQWVFRSILTKPPTVAGAVLVSAFLHGCAVLRLLALPGGCVALSLAPMVRMTVAVLGVFPIYGEGRQSFHKK